jgi:hypothetical protein
MITEARLYALSGGQGSDLIDTAAQILDMPSSPPRGRLARLPGGFVDLPGSEAFLLCKGNFTISCVE